MQFSLFTSQYVQLSNVENLKFCARLRVRAKHSHSFVEIHDFSIVRLNQTIKAFRHDEITITFIILQISRCFCYNHTHILNYIFTLCC